MGRKSSMQTTRGDATDREALVMCESDGRTLKQSEIVTLGVGDCFRFLSVCSDHHSRRRPPQGLKPLSLLVLDGRLKSCPSQTNSRWFERSSLSLLNDSIYSRYG